MFLIITDPAGWPECKSLATSKVCPLDQLRTTLAFAPYALIPRKNLKKTKWRRCGRSRSDAQVSDRITKNSERISQLKEPCAVNLSVLESTLKVYLKSLLIVPYIPEHFLSPDGYTSGHVAHIQLYTCRHLELPPLERHFYSSSHSTKLPVQGVTWCTTYLGARPLKWRVRGVILYTFPVVSPAAITICFSMFWETVPLPLSAVSNHLIS